MTVTVQVAGERTGWLVVMALAVIAIAIFLKEGIGGEAAR